MQQEFFGFGSIKNLKEILLAHNPKSILLVTGRKSYESSGAKKEIESILQGYNFSRFCDFGENPKLDDVKRGISFAKEKKADFVIAVGGGSAIDVAKSINVLLANKGNIENYIKGTVKIEKNGFPLVAIPTTSGTGSEATRFAVVYIGKVKQSLEHDFVLPDYSILDPSFTLSLPRKITASTALDALCQAVESYWSVHSTSQSREYSMEALNLILPSIEKACNSPDRKSREALAKGSNLAGKAINIAKTTACHAVSYPITSYFEVPHGHAVALTLGQMLVYNADVNEKDILDQRGVAFAKQIISDLVKVFGAKNPIQAGEKIKSIMESIELPARLSELGIKGSDVNIIIENGFDPNRVKNNPRMLTKDALSQILNKIS